MRVAGLSLVALAIGVASMGAAPAEAASWRCEASAARASVLGQALVEPVVANKDQALCRSASGLGSTGLPAPLSAGTLAASTGVTGSATDVAQQTVTATGGIVDFSLGLTPDLGIKIPVDEIVAKVEPVEVPLPLLPLVPGAPDSVTVDISEAVRSAIGDGLLNVADLVRVRSAVAFASGRCVGGSPVLDGQSRVAGVSLLGQDLGLLNGAVAKTLEVAGARSIDPSTLDVTKMVLPAGLAPEVVEVVRETALKPVLDALPNIEVPAALAQVSVVPGGTERSDGRLVQRALTISVSVLGQRLADTIVGEAVVGEDDVVCATEAQAALECTTRRLVLTDVFARGGRVVLTGAADKQYVGKRVDILFTHTNETVATAVVGADGTFRTTAALPAAELRGTNLARYQARIGSERSLKLKLMRRMAVTTVRVSGGKVRIIGRVLRPLAAPARTITISRRVSCTRNEVVARVKPDSTGAFSALVDAPPNQQAAVYRLTTRVRNNESNPKTYPTFTLPRYVDLAQ